MRHVKHLDSHLQECANNLRRNLRAFALIGRSKGFVQENDTVYNDCVYNRAHPAQFLIELSALHGGVFFAFEVGEDASTHVGAEDFSCHKHATLHHEIGETNTTEESRVTTAI